MERFRPQSNHVGTYMTRVGIIHVKYQTPGGEDVHVAHLQRVYENLGIQPLSPPTGTNKLPLQAVSSLRGGSFRAWDEWREKEKPSFLHLHNIHPTLGPSFLRWIIAREIPAMATIHNHRFYCTNGLAFYRGEPCKICRDRPSPWRPIRKNCNSGLSRSAYHALALSQIRPQGLLGRAFAALLVPSPYMAEELAKAGLHRQKIRLLPHFVDTEKTTSGQPKEFDVVYAGRLAEEKGVLKLMEAARLMPDTRFLVAGNGPLKKGITEVAGNLSNLRFLPDIDRPQLHQLMANSRVACAPSLCEESFSLFSAESLLLGLRLVVANRESMRWLTEPPFHAIPSDPTQPDDLVRALREALTSPASAPPAELRTYFSTPTFQRGLLRILYEDLGIKV